MNEAAEYANGLRQVADWIESHPDINVPNGELGCFTMNTKDEAAKVLLALKPCKKEHTGSLFVIARDFGPITLKYYFNRDQVCTARVVGTKVIPAQPERVIPAQPEQVVEEIEWDCAPVLTAQAPQETEAA